MFYEIVTLLLLFVFLPPSLTNEISVLFAHNARLRANAYAREDSGDQYSTHFFFPLVQHSPALD